MWEALGSETLQAGRDLAVAGLVYLAYKTAKAAGNNQGRRAALGKGLAYCLGIALLAAVMVGQPSCEEGDALFGGCSRHADNGFAPSGDQRAATFLYWLLIFGVPVTMGAMAALPHASNPWAKPDRTRM